MIGFKEFLNEASEPVLVTNITFQEMKEKLDGKIISFLSKFDEEGAAYGVDSDGPATMKKMVESSYENDLVTILVRVPVNNGSDRSTRKKDVTVKELSGAASKIEKLLAKAFQGHIVNDISEIPGSDDKIGNQVTISFSIEIQAPKLSVSSNINGLTIRDARNNTMIEYYADATVSNSELFCNGFYLEPKKDAYLLHISFKLPYTAKDKNSLQKDDVKLASKLIASFTGNSTKPKFNDGKPHGAELTQKIKISDVEEMYSIMNTMKISSNDLKQIKEYITTTYSI